MDFQHSSSSALHRLHGKKMLGRKMNPMIFHLFTSHVFT